MLLHFTKRLQLKTNIKIVSTFPSLTNLQQSHFPVERVRHKRQSYPVHSRRIADGGFKQVANKRAYLVDIGYQITQNKCHPGIQMCTSPLLYLLTFRFNFELGFNSVSLLGVKHWSGWGRHSFPALSRVTKQLDYSYIIFFHILRPDLVFTYSYFWAKMYPHLHVQHTAYEVFLYGGRHN